MKMKTVFVILFFGIINLMSSTILNANTEIKGTFHIRSVADLQTDLLSITGSWQFIADRLVSPTQFLEQCICPLYRRENGKASGS